jgi:hypothetical protein
MEVKQKIWREGRKEGRQKERKVSSEILSCFK